MQKTIPWKTWYRRIAFAFSLLLGLFSGLVGVIGLIAGDTSFNPRIPSALLLAIGVLITISVLDRRSEHEEHEEEVQKYEDIVAGLDQITPAISLTLGAIKNGVDHIYAKRMKDQHAEQAIVAHLSNPHTQTISIAAVALPNFFHPHEQFGEAVRRRLESDDVHWRLLLLDPRCEAAEERARRERATDTVEDIELSLRTLREIIDQGKNLEVHLYDTPPSIFLLITDHSLLYEPYHNGRVILPGDDRPIDERVMRGCIGGQIPLLQVRNTGVYDTTYPILCDHFAYLWEERSIRLFSGVRIEGCDPERRAIELLNGHRFRSIGLGNWRLDACPDSDDLALNKPRYRTLYNFTTEDWLEPGKSLTLTFGPEREEAPVGQLRTAQPDEEFLQRFWDSPARRLQLVNARDRVVGVFPFKPGDGYLIRD